MGVPCSTGRDPDGGACANPRHPSASGLMPGGGRNTLRMVLVVHRHGARFPTKMIGKDDPSWPQNPEFWEMYKGHLTPVGVKQLTDIGADFRTTYIDHPGATLFKDVERIDGQAVCCYTSNVQRTLQSAWSFLHGFLGPKSSTFFAYRSSSFFAADKFRRRLGVPIFIQENTREKDELFHEWKKGSDKEHKSWTKNNLKESPRFVEMSKDPKMAPLLEKLGRVTGRFEEGGDLIKKMLELKNLNTAIAIQQVHSQPVLANDKDITFSADEIDLVRRVGREAQQCWFQHSALPSERDKSFRGSKGAAGYLAHSIGLMLMHQKRRFIELSCHDTTCAALACHLGVEMPKFGFACHWVFEVHEMTDGEKHVRIFYNPDPTEGIKLGSLQPRIPPLAEKHFRPWEECEIGSVPLEAFNAHCQLAHVEEAYSSIVDLIDKPHEELSESKRCMLVKILEKHGTTEANTERFRELFDILDVNRNGFVTTEELSTPMAGHYNRHCLCDDIPLLEQLFALVDKSPEGGLSIEEFSELCEALEILKGQGHSSSISVW